MLCCHHRGQATVGYYMGFNIAPDPERRFFGKKSQDLVTKRASNWLQPKSALCTISYLFLYPFIEKLFWV